MNEVQSIIEESPERALEILDSLQPQHLNNQREKARFALLKSMALDKNYIDTTSFEILQPAIDYYLKNGNNDEKLRTYYYQGRIFLNRKEYAEAIHSFNLALEYEKTTSDTLGLALVYMAHGAINSSRYDLDNEIKWVLKAARLYKNIHNADKELECIQKCLISSIVLKNRQLADSLYRECQNITSEHTALERGMLNYQLQYYETFLPEDSTLGLLKRTATITDLTKDEHYAISNAYASIHRIIDAKKEIEKVRSLDDIDDTIKYLTTKLYIFENANEVDSAFYYYKSASTEIYDKMIKDAQNDLEFVHKTNQEENIQRLKLLKSKKRIEHYFFLIIFLALLITIAIFSIKYYKEKSKTNVQRAISAELEREVAKHERELAVMEKLEAQQAAEAAKFISRDLKNQMEYLKSEKENLESILAERRISKDAAKVLKERIGMLNKLITNQIIINPANIREYNNWIDNLIKDKDEFKRSTVLFYEATYPTFINYIRKKGLTTAEIEYLCLYALGMTGKEVGVYLEQNSPYNHTRIIRKKLEIPTKETNIRRYVTKLIDTLS